MSTSLSPEAVEALRRLNDVGIGRPAPTFDPSVTAELLASGLATEAGGDVEITGDGRQFLSADCD
jgi:hypothetical protein